MNTDSLSLVKQIEDVIQHLETIAPRFKLGHPKIGRPDNTYELSRGAEWTDGYWASQLWLVFAYLNEQNDPKSTIFRDAASRQTKALIKHYNENPAEYDHGIGHIFMPGVTLAYDLMNDEGALQAAIAAADSMLKRELLDTGVILAWNVKENYKPTLKHLVSGLTIIDTLDSIPLLYWVSNTTGDSKYKELATNHAKKIVQHLIREDGSTYHAFQFNPKTGEPVRGLTWQGYDDTSCWSRGQSWAIHGLSVAYLYTKDTIFLDAAKHTAQFAIDNLPDDFVPFWDYRLPKVVAKHKDSSAAAIMAAGLLNLRFALGNEKGKYYEEIAMGILKSLSENYFVGRNSLAEGLLLHGTSSFPDGRYNTMLPYGDFFYLQSLLRAANTKPIVW